MACFNPIEIPKYKHDKLKHIKHLVPCGQCVDCLNSKRASWTVRLINEERNCRNAFFVTLTYSNETVPVGFENLPPGEITRGESSLWKRVGEDDGKDIRYVLQKSDLQKFFKRYRKAIQDNYGIPYKHYTGEYTKKGEPCYITKYRIPDEYKMKYYAIGEYGEKTLRPHYHMICFNVVEHLIHAKWSDIGMIHAGSVTPQSINYVTSYVINKKNYGKRKAHPPFAIMSKGLGKDYITNETIRYHVSNFDSTIIERGGQRYAMPRYYKDLIFSEGQIKRIGDQNRERANEAIEGYEKEISKRQAKRTRFARSKKGKSTNF